MINTITLNASIEKRVYGNSIDSIYFEPRHTLYTNGGIGLKVCEYLKEYHIESKAYFITGQATAKFIKNQLNDLKIDFACIESSNDENIDLVMIEDITQATKIENKRNSISDQQLKMFNGFIKSSIRSNDVNVLEYNDECLSLDVIQELYQILSTQSEVVICDMHPKYYPIFSDHMCNVLIIDESQYNLYFNETLSSPLSTKIEMIKENICQLSKIVVYAIAQNDFILFVEGEMIRVVCSIHNKKMQLYKEALMSGVIKCYMEDGDLTKLSEECMIMSIATSLSDGLKMPNQETIAELKKSIHLYRV